MALDQNDLQGDNNYFEVQVTEGNITVNVRRKPKGN